jgi:hypothetical protein
MIIYTTITVEKEKFYDPQKVEVKSSAELMRKVELLSPLEESETFGLWEVLGAVSSWKQLIAARGSWQRLTWCPIKVYKRILDNQLYEWIYNSQ